jgi:hypothetical protein
VTSVEKESRDKVESKKQIRSRDQECFEERRGRSLSSEYRSFFFLSSFSSVDQRLQQQPQEQENETSKGPWGSIRRIYEVRGAGAARVEECLSVSFRVGRVDC